MNVILIVFSERGFFTFSHSVSGEGVALDDVMSEVARLEKNDLTNSTLGTHRMSNVRLTTSFIARKLVYINTGAKFSFATNLTNIKVFLGFYWKFNTFISGIKIQLCALLVV